jgi:NifU-like protein involved in Fe-S cluster formation
MTQLINRSRAEVRELTTSFFDMFEDEGSEQKPDLTPFMVVKKYPSRMSCVTLSWKSIKENL